MAGESRGIAAGLRLGDISATGGLALPCDTCKVKAGSWTTVLTIKLLLAHPPFCLKILHVQYSKA